MYYPFVFFVFVSVKVNNNKLFTLGSSTMDLFLDLNTSPDDRFLTDNENDSGIPLENIFDDPIDGGPFAETSLFPLDIPQQQNFDLAVDLCSSNSLDLLQPFS